MIDINSFSIYTKQRNFTFTFANKHFFVKKSFIYLIVILFSTQAFAQKGGTAAYSILDVKNSARVAAMGSDFSPFGASDINLAISNPSLINTSINNQVSLNYINLFSANGGLVSYARDFQKIGTFAASVEFMSYGNFQAYDEYEQEQGSFSAADYLFIIGWGRKLDSSFSIGANLKPIISQYESYSALALAVDVAANYHNEKYLIDVSLLAKNIGGQITAFNNEHEALPFQLELGFSKKLKKAPFRLMVFATNLQKWDLLYDDPLETDETNIFTGEEPKKQSDFARFADNLFRHVAVGVEFSPAKPFFIQLGYNYKTFKEMSVGEGFTLTGFSYGLGLRIKQFSIAYSRGNYHSAGSPNYITLTADLNYFLKGAAKTQNTSN